MHSEHHIRSLRSVIRQWRRDGHSIAFVPTMGNLHAGHMALVQRARQIADKVVVSIFVNPLQFGPNEDYDSYPRTLDADAIKLAEEGVDLLFAPSVEEMYPEGQPIATQVTVTGISDELCGASRPGFFTGVATVVSKLFNIVQPDIALFGQKDYQQLYVIRRMVADLSFPIEIVAVETCRESSGLAMSSRNAYLEIAQRHQATALHTALKTLASQIEQGEKDYTDLEQRALAEIEAQGLRGDYVSVRDAETLRPADENTRKLVVLAAAYLGKTRLIDNLLFEIQ